MLVLKITKVINVDVSQVKHWQNDPDARTKEEVASLAHTGRLTDYSPCAVALPPFYRLAGIITRDSKTT